VDYIAGLAASDVLLRIETDDISKACRPNTISIRMLPSMRLMPVQGAGWSTSVVSAISEIVR